MAYLYDYEDFKKRAARNFDESGEEDFDFEFADEFGIGGSDAFEDDDGHYFDE